MDVLKFCLGNGCWVCVCSLALMTVNLVAFFVFCFGDYLLVVEFEWTAFKMFFSGVSFLIFVFWL